MKKSIKVEIAIGVICLIIMMITVPGCFMIWSDDVLVVSWFKTVDANDLELIAEPNYLQIGSGQSKTKNDKIEAIIPGAGIIKTTGGSNE